MKKTIVQCLLFIFILKNVYAQNVAEIEPSGAKGFSFKLETEVKNYHLVQSTRDFEEWSIVAHFLGSGENVNFKDYRKEYGDFYFYRIITKSKPFIDGLYEREWKLVAMHEPDKTIFPEEGRIHSIKFDRDGNVSGRNDCNRYFGKCSIVNGNWLNFNTPFGSTLMFCMSDSLDFKFFESLKLAQGYDVKVNKLRVFYGNKKRQFLEFEEAE